MKKTIIFCVMAMSLVLFGACNGKKDASEAQPAKSSFSENYKQGEQCILRYEKALKAAKDCADLEEATSRFYTEAARVEVTDSTELAALEVLVEEAQKVFLAKYKELDCASQPEVGEE